jgi:phosphoglycerol transferase MdoB-like AlkP superfamily enzyme
MSSVQSNTPEKSIGDLIDEAVGINGPEDLLKLVLIGVTIAIAVVAWFMSRMEPYSSEWWSLFGFECVAALLMISSIYVVWIVLPSVQSNEPTISKTD